MIYKFISIHYILIILGCIGKPQELKRDAFLGLQLGSSINEFNKKIGDLVKNSQLTKFKSHFYYKTITSLNHKIYLIPVSFYPDNDTLINEIRVLYLDHLYPLNDGFHFDDDPIEDVKIFYKGESPLNLVYGNPDLASSLLIRDVALNQLKEKYGNYDAINSETDESYYKTETMHWNNRNDVNITLEYKRDMIATYYRSNVILKYQFTSEMSKKVFKSKSIY